MSMKSSVWYILKLPLSIFIGIVVGRTARFVYRQIYFVLMFPFYGRLHHTCFISTLASIRGHHLIFLGPNSVINRNSIVWGRLVAGNNLQLNPGACIYG